MQHLLDTKQKSSLLNSLGTVQIRRFFSKNIPHIEALEKAKPHPHFQKILPASKKKKPLSRRVNHALIAALMANTKSLILVIIYQSFNNIQTNSASLFFIKTCDNVRHGFGTPIYFQLLLSTSNGCIENPMSDSF